MSALRECPFCGGCEVISRGFAGNHLWRGQCRSCESCGPVRLDEDETIAAWNRRAGDDEAEKLRAELAAAKEVEQHARDFLRWVTANGFTDPENMLVCAEWENLRNALGDTP